ncbi:hypothetical protein ID866_9790 [Astraeus odoratus]|nr:hypothetical protein ID866_9790 [Astraeus odoratus]
MYSQYSSSITLTKCNLLIDWSTSSITFHTFTEQVPVHLLTPSDSFAPGTNPGSSSAPDPTPGPMQSDPASDVPGCAPLKAPHISLINAAAFVHACKLEGKAKASTLPPHHKHDLKIDLEEGTTPPLRTIYSLSSIELKALCTFINKNLSMGFICPTSSLHATPVLFAQKKDGSLHLCVDYHGLNKLTKKDHYLLPLLSDLLDSPSHAKIYTKIDLWHAYHLIWIALGDEWKTTFWTCYGSYEWLVMPFGLTNTLAVFQHFVNTIFADMLDISLIMYLNDILIYLGNKEKHKEHVKEVLWCLCKHGLYAKPEKCKFHSDSVEYLGYHLSPESLTMSQDKIKTIVYWPEPCKVKDVQSFLDFANFYCWFIFNYSDIVVPLTCLTWKDMPWNFTDKCCSAFNHFKDTFTSTPVLTHFVLGPPLMVETDTSDYDITCILSITCDDGQIHPVMFHSWMWSTPELNYDMHNKELLAIFEAFHTLHHYLEGMAAPVDVVTDHKNLKYFSTSKVLTQHQACWSEFLSQFNLIICFCPGKLGAKPDTLTR